MIVNCKSALSEEMDNMGLRLFKEGIRMLQTAGTNALMKEGSMLKNKCGGFSKIDSLYLRP